MNPFVGNYNKEKDLLLVKEAREGSRKALDELIKAHQRFIFNVALNFVKDPNNAADLSQEALIKMVTKLDQFKGNSSFRSWLYKIVMNHFLQSKKKRQEKEVYSFEEYGSFLENVHVEEEMTEAEHQHYNKEIVNTRNKCLSSMLLCLDREQRIVFILGAIFNIKSTDASDLLGITSENFRKQLSRAKADLFRFMDNKCGLINPNNPCKCSKKTKGFIKEGKVEQSSVQFEANYLQEIEDIAPLRNSELDQLLENKYLSLFKKKPYGDKDVRQELIATLLLDKDLVKIFNLN